MKIRLPKSGPLAGAMDSVACGLGKMFKSGSGGSKSGCDTGCDSGCACGHASTIYAQPSPMQLTPAPPASVPMGTVPAAPMMQAMPSMQGHSSHIPQVQPTLPNDARQSFVDPIAPPTPEPTPEPLAMPLTDPGSDADVQPLAPEPMPMPEAMPEPIPAPRPIDPPGSMFDRLSNPFEDDSAYRAAKRAVQPASYDRNRQSRTHENLQAEEFNDYFRR